MIAARLPIRTHIVTGADDIVDVIKQYAGPLASPGDIIAVAESVVAISQGRARTLDQVRPGLLARTFCRYAGKDGSLSTPPSLQVGIEEVGSLRFLLGLAAAGLGRLARRRGDFFRVAGRQMALIDDFAGTMWPFDRHIVPGPRDPQRVVERIKAATGAEAIVSDVNDMGKVDILAATDGVDQAVLLDYLRDNPFGNDDQQTPIVIFIAATNMPDRQEAALN